MGHPYNLARAKCNYQPNDLSYHEIVAEAMYHWTSTEAMTVMCKAHAKAVIFYEYQTLCWMSSLSPLFPKVLRFDMHEGESYYVMERIHNVSDGLSYF
jgi:hypothetical protein